MECTICFDPIDEKTGSATLSCGHIYHFGCLARWILKSQTCPYCRHETNAFETIHQDEELSEEADDESEDESTTISDEPSLRWVRIGRGHWRTFPHLLQQIPEYNEEDHALWVFRSFFQALESEQKPASEKQDHHIPYIDLLTRHENTFDAGNTRGYDSA
jgi:hypothetical protein